MRGARNKPVGLTAESGINKRAADYFSLSEADLNGKRGQHRQQPALVMALLHRYGGLRQRMIGERFGGLDKGLVSGIAAIREKIETEPKIRKWFQDFNFRRST